EEVLAFVAQKPGTPFEPRALIAHCRQQLARYKCPTRVELLSAIPRNAAGKIEKAGLREPYWANLPKKV
ncbi:AMP-dependent synthetase, partial [Alkalihalobacillus clausii]|uniref:AMP-binding enzyme n=1 Tax=Shouchella clausii TaxID=79880 RepID=UPI0027FACB98|nr:AMP-dependent synthetase [Shouchella clausii]